MQRTTLGFALVVSGDSLNNIPPTPLHTQNLRLPAQITVVLLHAR